LSPTRFTGISEPVSGAVPAVNDSEAGHVNVLPSLFRFQDDNRGERARWLGC
jgi:hypothetical protein